MPVIGPHRSESPEPRVRPAELARALPVTVRLKPGPEPLPARNPPARAGPDSELPTGIPASSSLR